MISGTAGDDVICGLGGDDVLEGLGGNDVIFGGAGADQLRGGDGNDRLVPGAGDDSVVDGEGGTDTLSYEGATGGVVVDLLASTATGMGIDSLAGIEHVSGTSHADVITGDGAGNVLDGAAGNDAVSGGSGNDFLYGSSGDDELSGDAGDDRLRGAAGDDTLNGGVGADRLVPGSGNDANDGGDGRDILDFFDATTSVSVDLSTGLSTGDGNDTIVSVQDVYGSPVADQIVGDYDSNLLLGSGGNDELGGHSGNDQLLGGAGNDTLHGDNQADRLDGGAGDDGLFGGADADRLIPGTGVDAVDGEGGTDMLSYEGLTGGVTADLGAGAGPGGGTIAGVENLSGTPQADDLTGSSGPNVVYAQGGADTVRGGDAADDLYGHSGADVLYGDAGADRLYGNGDDDDLFGGADADRLMPAAGDDDSDGGLGVDVVDFFDAPGAMTVDLAIGTATGHGTDTVTAVESVGGSIHNDSLTGDANNNLLAGKGGVDTIVAAGGDDILQGGALADDLQGDAGRDILHGEAGSDTLAGGDDDDFIFGRDGDDVLTGGAGHDSLHGHDGVDAMDGGDDDDYFEPGPGNETSITGGHGYDYIVYHNTLTGITIDLDAGEVTGGSGNDTFTGMEGAGGTSHDDIMFGDANFNYFFAGAGSDTVSGRGGPDLIHGEAGDDFLRGGAGDVDTVDGGADTDTCGEASDTQNSCELQFNVPPTLNITDSTNSYEEDAAATAVDSTLTLVDDEANTDGATVTIGSGFESGKDTLSVSGALPAGVTASYVAPTLTISGVATVAQYQAILRGVKFENTSQDPNETDRVISFTVTDGEETDGSGNDVTMSVVAVNDAPVADADSYGGGQQGMRMRVGTTHADTHEVEVAGNVLDGDADVDTPANQLTTTPGTFTTTDGGVVTMASDGSFLYDPAAGDDGSDSFSYTVEDNDTGDGDGEKTHTATVTITQVGPRIWFVNDDAPAGGRGVSHAPLQSLAPLSTGGAHDAKDGTNDRIFVYEGTYTNGIDLEAGQRLLGQPNGLNVSGTQFVVAGGSKPAISSATGHGVALHSASNEVQDLALGNTPAGSYSLHAPAGVGTFTVADTDIVNGSGGALHVADGTPAVTLGTLSSTGSANHGVRIADTEGGLVTATGGLLSNATSADFSASNSNTAVTLGSAISDDQGQLVNVSGGTGDVTYNGTITDLENGTGDGISIANTAGDHNFTKSVLLSTGNANAMSMTNSTSGSLRMVPSTGVNRSTTTGGAALTVTDTPIASGGLSFEKVSAVDPSIEATTYGIHLRNTGSAAGLTVAGAGGTCTQADNSGCTGGTIQGKSTAIKLDNTAGSSFTRMKLTNTGDFGIKGDTVTGFVLNASVVDGSGGRHGNDANANEGAISFDELFGTGVAITNSVIKEGVSNDLRVRNDSGTLNRLTITGSTFGSTATTHNDSVQLENNGSGSLNATIGGPSAGQGNTFTSARGDHVQASIQGTGAGDIEVLGNALSNSHPTSLGGQIVLGASASGDMTYDVTNNTITGAIGTAIVTTATFASGMATSTAVGTISGNTIGQSNVAGSGSSAASGIDVSVIGNGRNSVQILNNTIRQMSQHGIIAFAGGASRTTTGTDNTGDLNVTVSGNLVEQPHNTGSSSSGFQLNAGTNSDGGPDRYDVCLGFSNNNMAAAGEELSSNSRDYVLLQAFETFVRMPGWTGPVTSQDASFAAAMTSYLDARDTGASTPTNIGRTNPTDFDAGIADGFYNTAGGAPCSTS